MLLQFLERHCDTLEQCIIILDNIADQAKFGVLFVTDKSGRFLYYSDGERCGYWDVNYDKTTWTSFRSLKDTYSSEYENIGWIIGNFDGTIQSHSISLWNKVKPKVVKGHSYYDTTHGSFYSPSAGQANICDDCGTYLGINATECWICKGKVKTTAPFQLPYSTQSFYGDADNGFSPTEDEEDETLNKVIEDVKADAEPVFYDPDFIIIDEMFDAYFWDNEVLNIKIVELETNEAETSLDVFMYEQTFRNLKQNVANQVMRFNKNCKDLYPEHYKKFKDEIKGMINDYEQYTEVLSPITK